ncbi:unnamed protein product [Natator depressus]
MLPRGSQLLPAALLALGACLAAGAPQPPSPPAPWSPPSTLASRGPLSPPPSPDTGWSPESPIAPTSPGPTGPRSAPPSPSLPPSSLAHPTATLGWGIPGDGGPQRTPGTAAGDSGRQGAPGRGGVKMVLLVERVERRGRPDEHHGAGGGQAMGLFLAASGLLLCLFSGIYCAYRRGAKGSPFAHQRLQDGSLEDLALNLDSPKGSYDWFLYEMDDNKFPAPLQPAQAPPWPCPPLQPPLPAPQTPPGDKTPGPTGSEQPKPSPPRLECLSPANLPAGNFL